MSEVVHRLKCLCVYCGTEISDRSLACHEHKHLPNLDPYYLAFTRRPKTHFRPTCGKCGEICRPSAKQCPQCHSPLYAIPRKQVA